VLFDKINITETEMFQAKKYSYSEYRSKLQIKTDKNICSSFGTSLTTGVVLHRLASINTY